MRRPILLASLLAVTLVMSAPVGMAAARIDVRNADAFNQQNVELTRIEVATVVKLQASVQNIGDAEHKGPLSLVFHIKSADGKYNETRTITNDVTLAVKAWTNVTHTWTANRTGSHSLRVYVPGEQATAYTLTFTVAKSEVSRGNLLERALDYVWVYAGFIAAVVLFFAVARVRKPR